MANRLSNGDSVEGGVYFDTSGLDEFETELQEYLKLVSNPLETIEPIAQDLVKDLMKLTSPKSSIKKSGYTHMIDSFGYEVNATDIAVGWGKWYGYLVENGLKQNHKKGARAMIKPTYQNNIDKYLENFRKRNNLI